MKLLKKIIVLIIATVIVFFLGFNFIYKEKTGNFFKEGIQQVYVNKGVKAHNYDYIKKLMVENGKEDLWKKIDLGRKTLKDVYLFSFDTFDENLKNEVMVVDAGIYYLGARWKLDDYFNKVEDYYMLREEKKPKELLGVDIYLKPNRGYFIIATSKEVLDFFLKSDKTSNLALLNMNKNIKSENLGSVLTVLDENEVFTGLGINGVVTNLSVKNEKLKLSNEIFGEGKLRETLLDQPSERKYSELVGENRVYISGNNIGNTIALILESMNSKELANFNMVFGMLGIKVEDVFNQIDGEIITDVKTGNFIIPLRETKVIRNIFGFFGQKDKMIYGDKEIILDENVLRIGTIEKSETPVKIVDDSFFYADLPMQMYDKAFDEEARGKTRGSVTKNGILFELELNEIATKNIAEEAF